MTAMTATTAQPAPFNLDALMAASVMVEAERRAEPAAAWMRAQGYDPEDGYVLVLPTSMVHLAANLPSYVWTSPLVLEPVIVRNMLGRIRTSGLPSYNEWFQ